MWKQLSSQEEGQSYKRENAFCSSLTLGFILILWTSDYFSKVVILLQLLLNLVVVL